MKSDDAIAAVESLLREANTPIARLATLMAVPPSRQRDFYRLFAEEFVRRGEEIASLRDQLAVSLRTLVELRDIIVAQLKKPDQPKPRPIRRRRRATPETPRTRAHRKAAVSETKALLTAMSAPQEETR